MLLLDITNFRKIYSFHSPIPHLCTSKMGKSEVKNHIYGEISSSMPNFTFIGAMSLPCWVNNGNLTFE